MKKETRDKARARHIETAWESWEMILYTKLSDLEHLKATIRADLSAAGLPFSKSEQYLADKIGDMIEQLQEIKANRAI